MSNDSRGRRSRRENEFESYRQSFVRLATFLRERQKDRTLSDERAEGLTGLFWAMTHQSPAQSTSTELLPPVEIGRKLLSAPDSAFDGLGPTTKDLRTIRQSLGGITAILGEYLPTFESQIQELTTVALRKR